MRIPLIEDLTAQSIPIGCGFMVEYDPASLWYAASVTIAAGWLRTGGRVGYAVSAQPPDNIRSQLKRLGLNSDELEENERLGIWDWYTCTLGRKSKEKYAVDSLKVADLSLIFARTQMGGPPPSDLPPMLRSIGSDMLRIVDDISCLSRFNGEKTWVEFVLTRIIPSVPLTKSNGILGIIRGLHDDWVYKRLEGAVDGVIDFKLDDSGEEPRNMIRIRSMRKVGFDARWRQLKIDENSEVSLEE